MTTATKICLEAIPSELKLLAQWVLWRYEIREGKQTKVPYRADGAGMASTTNKDTWASFQDACDALSRGNHDGFGFVFSPDDPYAGVDLDKCRNPETGVIDQWARDIINALNSYAEVTPSGKGVHVIVEGKLPPGRRREGDVEMYDSGRYFTITGHHLEGTPATIEVRQEQLDQLHAQVFPKTEPVGKPGGNGSHPPVDLSDTELIAKTENAKNGAAFRALWRGDTSTYGGDDSAADMALCCHLAFRAGNDPARIDRLFRQSGLYREKWEREDYRVRTIAKAIEGTGETYTPEHTRPKEQTTDAETKQFNLTDLGNAERLIHLFGGILRYSHERRKWLDWSGKVWEWDTGEKVAALAKKAVRSIYAEAANEPNDKMRGQLAEHAKRSESGARIEAMMTLAQSEEGVSVKIADLDRNGWLLNVQNGTLDLRSGTLLPHAKEDLLTILLPTEYHPDAQCPLWQSMIDRMTDQDREFGAYLQRAVGYTLTADTKQQAWFFLYGLGNNCKSTFTMTLRRLLGDYAERLDAEDLMIHDKGQRGGPKEGIADLRGKRYVVGSEVQNGRHLNVSLLKDMCGGETIKARRLYEHQIEFSPTHKLWLFGNHKPVIGDSTLSIWRRLKLIHLCHTIPDAEIDLDFAQKLEQNELPGILAWAVRGCLDWQANGLGQPRRVTDATAAYRHEQDIIGDFLEDCTRFRAGATVIKKALKEAYLNWCEKNSSEPAKHKDYLNALAEKGITDSRGSKGVRVWVGLELLSPMSPESDKKEGENRIQGDTSDKTDAYVPQSPHMRENLIDFRGTPRENCHPTPEGDKKCHPDPSEDLPPSDPCPRCGKDSWGFSEDCTYYVCSECGYERR